MKKKIRLFDDLFHGVCEIGKQIRAGQWTDSGRSIEDWEKTCRSQSGFIYSAKHSDVEQYTNAKSKVESGDWFVSNFFHGIIVHMQLLEAIEGADYSVEMDLLETLAAHLGNGAYFEKNRLNSLMECAGNLYLAAEKSNHLYKARLDESTQLLIAAVKELKREGARFLIVQGAPEFDEDSERILVSKLDTMIKQIGGMFVIRQLFEQEISKRYNAQLGRYLIYRNKTSFYGTQTLESRIPYQYLLQLSLKHLRGNTPLSETYKRSLYEKMIHMSKAYLEVLQLQGYSVIGELFEPLEDFPYRLSRNLCFEKMYIPRQYHPAYIKLLLHKMLEPFYAQGAAKPRVYSFFHYVKLAEYILENAVGPRIFTKREWKDALGIAEYKLNMMLEDLSLVAEEVNPDFLHYLDETNTWRKPLIKLDEERYFCLDGRMAGYAFYEVMYQILFAAMGSSLSKKQGPMLEQMVYQMFRDKHFSYVTGRYQRMDDMPERDCDMILESMERVMFLEIKKCPLPGSYEQGDDVKVLQALGDGMLYAQEQILWHKVRLKEKGVLELYDAKGNRLPDYTPGKKLVMAVSICMPEYDFLTDRNITEAFLESTLLVSYHAVDPQREKLLKKLNKRAQTIQTLAGRLFDGRKFDVREVFFRSQFRSLQQIWTMLQFCETVEEFLELCSHQMYVITGAGDVYVDIMHALRLQHSS